MAGGQGVWPIMIPENNASIMLMSGLITESHLFHFASCYSLRRVSLVSPCFLYTILHCNTYYELHVPLDSLKTIGLSCLR